MIALGIVGSRNFVDYIFFNEKVNEWITNYGKPDKIISGGALGIDTLAEKYAKEKNIPFVCFPADWKKYGKSAGPKRNAQIINSSTHLIAFPGPQSTGTLNSIKLAQIKKINTTIINVSK